MDLLFSGPAGTALVFGGEVADPGLLLFADPPGTSLVFGGDSTVPVVATEVSIAGVLPALGAHITAAPVYRINLVATLPALGAVAAAHYISGAARPTVSQVVTFAAAALSTELGVMQPEQHAKPIDTGVSSLFVEAMAVNSQLMATAADATPADGRWEAGFQEAATALDLLSVVASHGLPATRAYLGGFQEASRHQAARARGRFQDGLHDKRTSARPLWVDAVRKTQGYRGHAGAAVPRHAGRDSRFQDGKRPDAGMTPATPITPFTPCYTPSGALLFGNAWSRGISLLFTCGNATDSLPPPVATLYILPARFYMTTHSIYAQRLPDLADIPIFGATVSADSGSYCWTLSATGPLSLFEQLAPVGGLPVQLRVTMDGIPWVFAVDSLQRSTSFGKSGVSISGRSVTALVGAPYLRAMTRDNAGNDRLAQQLALDALQSSGVGLYWGLNDWLVPAGAWSHQGTPLDAVQAIAQAAGGYLQSHRSAPTLLARHPYSQRTGDYPGAPWGWMTGPADVELAPDAIITEGTERKDGADINAVYVSGTTAGVLGLVKRAGTAADKLAAMVSDALITDTVAARQRGLSILGAAGAKHYVSLSLPVLTGVNQPGVFDVGQLVQINAATPWRGRVRSVSVDAKRPSLRQTITLERHLETA